MGAFQITAGSRNAALVVTLAAGAYNLQAGGADVGAREVLAEVYEVAP